MKNLVKAVNAVMNDVKSIDKSMTVGEGRNSYKGVADKDVKDKIGHSMAQYGLALFPTVIERVLNETPYTDKYGNQKLRVFVEVVTKYLLVHESGEQIEITGYGHGTDSQDKAAGKATTYALKYALLYTFLVPTGKIDDTDNTNSEELPQKPDLIPQLKSQTKPLTSNNKQKPTPTPEVWERALSKLGTGETDKDTVKKALYLTPEQIKIIDEL